MNHTLEDFITFSRQTKSLDELFSLYVKFMYKYGYDQIAHAVISDHQHLSNNNELGLARQTNMDAWTEHYTNNNYIAIDPGVPITSANSGFFTWEYIAQQDGLSNTQLNIFNEANELGLHHGINVSMHGPSGVKCVAIASSSQKEKILIPNAADKISLLAYQFNSCFLDLFEHQPKQIAVKLSHREQEILKWLSTGLTKIEVGEKIHLSQHTVNFHMRNIFKKLSAKNTAAALVTAIKLKQITL